MKTKSRFKLLPAEDQQRILDLCNQHPYEEVVDLIAKPRAQGGLQFQTSISAVCRFFTRANKEARKTIIIRQTATSLQAERQYARGAMHTGILHHLETRIFEALTNGTPVSELKDQFAALKEVHKGFLAEEKLRLSKDYKRDQEVHNYQWTSDSHYDYIPLDEQGEPTEPPPLSPSQISSLEQDDGTDELTEKNLQDIDDQVALSGEDAINNSGFPRRIVQERYKLHHQRLRERGITPLQAALEVHYRKHGFAPDGTRLPKAPTPAAPAPTGGAPAPSPSDRSAKSDSSDPSDARGKVVEFPRADATNSTQTPRHST